jgi:glycosyltransferase involved in cell wall biosynthesis
MCPEDEEKHSYILITPVKNEEANLTALVQSIADQDLRPTVWFIVDDASEDKSYQIISRVASEYPWIHPVKLDVNTTYDIGKHYASVCITGFDRALTYCERNNIKFQYIALSDADMIYPKDYFASCIDFLRDNPQYGIVSGRILVKDRGTTQEEDSIDLGDGAPRGTGRVWKKEAFSDTGGYMLAESPDTISNVKALSRGWKIKRLPDVICYQTRYTGEKPGLWSGYFNRGERAYYLSVTPLSIFNAVVDMIFISRTRGCFTKSLALFSGYCRAFLRREERLEDEEVKKYLGSYKRVLKNYWLFIKGFRKKRNLREP